MKKLLIFAFLFCSVFCVFGEAFVSDIKISGLRKTKDEFMDGLLEKYKGVPLKSVNLDEVETLLRAQELFSDIELKFLDENGNEFSDESSLENDSENVCLSVKVKEKITFIPLPFASYSSGGFMGGFMLMNMNLGGRKNMLVCGGIFSSSMQMGMVTFSHPAKDLNHPGYSLFTSFSNKEMKINDFGGNKIEEFDIFHFGAQGSINLKINDFLNCSTGFQYMLNKSLDDEISDVQQWLVNSSFGIGKSKWNGWYMIDSGASVKGACGYSTDNELIYEAAVLSHYEIPVFERCRIGFKLNGSVEANKSILLEQGRGEIASTVMADGFKSEKLFCSGMSFEGALAETPVGIVTLYGLYEFDMAEDYDDKAVYCHGPGFGLRFYFKQLAFPAFSGGATYNVTENLWQYAISVGISM